MQDLRRQLADEVHVVRDEDQRALVVLQREDQRLHGEDVEVRGRLVHQQEIRRDRPGT